MSESLPKPVEKALNPLGESIGESLRDIWEIVIGNRLDFKQQKSALHYAKKLNEYRQEIEDSVEKIPKENRIEPNFQTVSQAIEESKYCIDDDDIRRMFVKLISSSMDKAKAGLTHPSFANIIKQLNSKDAVVFKLLFEEYGPNNFQMAHVYLLEAGSDRYFSDALPQLSIKLQNNPFDIFTTSNCFGNLAALGLVDISEGMMIQNNPNGYKDLKNNEEIQEILSKYSIEFPRQRFELKDHPCMGKITEFGRRFAKCCLG